VTGTSSAWGRGNATFRCLITMRLIPAIADRMYFDREIVDALRTTLDRAWCEQARTSRSVLAEGILWSEQSASAYFLSAKRPPFGYVQPRNILIAAVAEHSHQSWITPSGFSWRGRLEGHY
jgi:hypothetical protein